MKLKYESKKRSRFKRLKFQGIHCQELGWWYVENSKTWKRDSELTKNDYPYSNADMSCNSVKGFIRRLKKWPKGLGFTFEHRYVGCNVYGVGSKEG